LYAHDLFKLVTGLVEYLAEHHFDEVVDTVTGSLQHIRTWFVPEEQPEHSQLDPQVTDITPMGAVDCLSMLRALQEARV
jgi:hypothetical protein